MQHDPADRPRLRRVPQQSRSRDRVEKILDTAAAQVVAHGVEAVGTRSIAEAAGVPVASLYQYFADKDDILLALVERDIEAMDARVQADLGALPRFTIRSIVEATRRGVRRGLPRAAGVRDDLPPRPDQRRDRGVLPRATTGTSPGRCSTSPRTSGCSSRTPARSTPRSPSRWATGSSSSRSRRDMDGDPMVIDEALKVLTAYLELYASPAGLKGVDA